MSKLACPKCRGGLPNLVIGYFSISCLGFSFGLGSKQPQLDKTTAQFCPAVTAEKLISPQDPYALN